MSAKTRALWIPTTKTHSLLPQKHGNGTGKSQFAHWHNRKVIMKILIVLTSHDQLGDTGKKTGFWLEEFAAPYYVFKDAGATITLASPKGGQPPLDPKSDEPAYQTAATARYKADAESQTALAGTLKLSNIWADRSEEHTSELQSR